MPHNLLLQADAGLGGFAPFERCFYFASSYPSPPGAAEAPSVMRPPTMFDTGVRFAFFVLGVAGLYALPVLSMEMFKPGFGTGFVSLLLLVVFLIVAAGGLVAVVRNHRRQSKWLTWGAVAAFALWFPACTTGSLGTLGDQLYFARREAPLRDLAARIEHYGTIESMSDGRRHFKTINGYLYRGAGSNPDGAVPLAVALDSAGVSTAAYEDIRQRMINVGIVSFKQYEGRTAFVIDGFIDNYSGLIYVPNGPDPEYGEYAPEGEIIALTRVAPGWWIYATT